MVIIQRKVLTHFILCCIEITCRDNCKICNIIIKKWHTYSHAATKMNRLEDYWVKLDFTFLMLVIFFLALREIAENTENPVLQGVMEK